MKTNFSITPRNKIALKDLTDYTKIKHIFKRANIQRYLYIIRYNGDIIKIGIQWKKQDWADRIYTQIGHMPGWNKPLLKRSDKKTGTAIRSLIAKVDSISYHKDNVEVEIFDFTNYPFQMDSSIYAEMQNAEEELKLEFYKTYNRYPAGNIKQEPIRSIVQYKTFSDLFLSKVNQNG